MIGANRSIEEALGGDSAKFRDPEGLPRGSVIRQDGTPMPIEERPGYVAMKTGKPVTGIELGIPRREGGVRWLSGSAFPVFERNGTILGSVLQFTDISDRRRTERQLQIQHDLSLRLGATTDLTEGLRTCLYAAMSLVDMDAGGIYLLNKDSGALDLVIHKGISEEFAKTASRYEAGSDHVRAVMAGNPFYARYPTQGPSFTEGQAREGLRFMAVIPMTHRGEVIGCLNLGSHSLDDLSQSDRTLLETIALRASQAIARIKAEAELRGQEKRFRALI
jgi:hypothetical protein